VKMFWSENGGRSWQSRDLPVPDTGFGTYWPADQIDRPRWWLRQVCRGFDILSDDTFVGLSGQPRPFVMRSTDRGRTWSKPFELDLSPYNYGGGGWPHIMQLPDGTALMTVTLRHGTGANDKQGNPLPQEKQGIYAHIYRSTDSGKTWGDKTMIAPDSAEVSLLMLKSGKMLAAIRVQRVPQTQRPGETVEQLKAKGFWNEEAGQPWVKHGFLADSHDMGRTWVNLRHFPSEQRIVGLCPGELLQLADERVILLYCHRYEPDSGIYARVSHDDGRTWTNRRYCIRRFGPRINGGNGAYPTSTVRPDGTILTVVGAGYHNKPMAVRWRLP